MADVKVEEPKPKIEIRDITKESPRVDVKFFKAFHLHYESDLDGIRDGTFVLKRMTLGDYGKQGVRLAELNGGFSSDAIGSNASNLHAMISFLDVALLERPSWFKPLELFDEGLVTQVFVEAMKFEQSFRRDVGGPGKEASEVGKVESPA